MPALDPFAQVVGVALAVGLLALLLWAGHQYRGRDRTDVGWPVLLALLYVGAFGLAASVGILGLFLAFSVGVAWTWFLGWHLLYKRLPRGWRHLAFGIVAGTCCAPLGVPVLGFDDWVTLHVPALFALVLAVPSAQELRSVLAVSACPWLIMTAAAVLVSLGAARLSRARQHRQMAAAAPGEPDPDCWPEPPGRFPHVATVLVGILLTAATVVGLRQADRWYTETLASALVRHWPPNYPLAVEANAPVSLLPLVEEHIAARLPATWRDSQTGGTQLHAAACQGNPRCVQALLAAGADVNAADNAQRTPLFYAARTGQADIVARLLKAGAEVNATDDCQATALHCAVNSSSLRTVEHLLQAGADANAADSAQWTPLFYAARAGHADIVARLLKAGAKVTARDYRGKTALHRAVERSDLRTVELLVQAGADVNAKDGGGQTPADLAREGSLPEILKLLESHGGTPGQTSPK